MSLSLNFHSRYLIGPSLVHICEQRGWGHGEGKTADFQSYELWEAELEGKLDMMGKLIKSLLRVGHLVLVDLDFPSFKAEGWATWEYPQFQAK